MGTSLYHPGRVMQLILRDEYGNDDVVLDICGPNQGDQGIYLLDTFSGLYHAPRTPVRESWAYQEGSTPSDHPRVDERIVDLRLATKGHTPELWEQIDSLLWDVLGFKHDAYLRWYSNGGKQWRELKVRLDRKPSDAMLYEPGITKHMVWNITLVACDPWWYSQTLVSTFTNTAGTGNGYVILENPADQPCWIQWSGREIAAGTTETWTLPDGVAVYPAGHSKAGQLVTHTLPTLNSSNKGFLVDTHPLAELLQVLDGSQQWAKMRAEAFLFSLPPHTPPTQVPVKLVGGTTSSSITAYMMQRYDRPWGGEAR